ncbi:MAG: hypothetical protein WEC15_03810 [Flavobacteriales bacterium]
MSNDAPYSMNEHRLRFAAWTCARAIARGTDGAKTKNVHRTIIAAGIEKELEKKSFTSNTDYDKWHAKMVQRMLKAASQNGMALSFGQGAKLLAIYIKTLYIISGQRKDLLKYAHPPIDRFLLKNALPKGEKSKLHNLAWTQFDQDRYTTVFAMVETHCGNGKERWMIEQCWHPWLTS